MRPARPTALPKLTHAPWAGYTAREHKRPEALARCPSPRCKRLKLCVAAHNDLYCQRTHMSHVAFLEMQPRRPAFSDDLELRREQMVDQIENNRAAQQDMIMRWKAGALDHLYGKHKPGGVVLKPPPRIYQEG